ncbi:dipeptidase [Bacillus testis]|uniref:dipeptidase n=1 Tax=Bacillus testis TaxID=1622072 RepID=UPI00067EFDEE|nr:dipeptidase [Bacillus testis]
MKIIDMHCDVPMKLLLDETLSFTREADMDVTLPRLRKGGAKLQYFALYVPEHIPPTLRFQAVLAMVIKVQDQILAERDIKLIRSKKDYDMLEDGEIGAILSLEGCDCLQENLSNLRTLQSLGVTAVGLTWNYANVYGDGAKEPRNAGLSLQGKKLVTYIKEEEMLLDLSHLNEAGFWDCLELGGRVFASHSNCRALCETPRNLYDSQVQALIKRDSLIGITFVPQFLHLGRPAAIQDIIRHIDHICSLGGEKNVGFGSDFDGIDHHVTGLTSFDRYPLLIEELQLHFSEEQVEGFAFRNYERVLLK